MKKLNLKKQVAELKQRVDGLTERVKEILEENERIKKINEEVEDALKKEIREYYSFCLEHIDRSIKKYDENLRYVIRKGTFKCDICKKSILYDELLIFDGKNFWNPDLVLGKPEKINIVCNNCKKRYSEIEIYKKLIQEVCNER